MTGNDHPVLRQGNGVGLLDPEPVATVTITGTEADARETWSYRLTDRDDTAAFAVVGNRVFVAGGTSVRAPPVF
ncbi:hypothetical protein ACFY8B_04935 [Streptomyces sp. NPDC012751]|uniref:hypothetical protein n=1 Tax=Streptomyces sp. NPDC012751 TaxID=3364846 RepID=UPI0036921094